MRGGIMRLGLRPGIRSGLRFGLRYGLCYGTGDLNRAGSRLTDNEVNIPTGLDSDCRELQLIIALTDGGHTTLSGEEYVAGDC